MNRFNLLLISLLLPVLASCQHSAYFEQKPLANPDNAMVYVYRPKATNPGKKPLRTSYPEILVNGGSQGFLKYNSHLVLELPPGKSEFVATGLTRDARWKPKDVDYRLALESGKTYFLRLRVEFDINNMPIGTITPSYLIHMHPVDEEEAVYEIRYTDETL